MSHSADCNFARTMNSAAACRCDERRLVEECVAAGRHCEHDPSFMRYHGLEDGFLCWHEDVDGFCGHECADPLTNGSQDI